MEADPMPGTTPGTTSKNPFRNVTLGSVVAGLVGYLGAHLAPDASPVLVGGFTLLTYLVGALFHRNPQPPQ
jgi:hypothetical protein